MTAPSPPKESKGSGEKRTHKVRMQWCRLVYGRNVAIVLHTHRTSAPRLQAPRRGCGWASVLLHLLMKRIGNADGLVAAWRDVQYWTDGMGQPLQEGHGKALVVKYPLFC